MTERKLKTVRPRLEALMAQDRDLLKALVKEALDQILQAEMTEFLGAAPGERSGERLGYRAGYYERGLITRVGKIELRVPAIGRGSFRRRCSSAFSVARRRWCRPWWRCTCRACRRAR
jgi:putative transposase